MAEGSESNAWVETCWKMLEHAFDHPEAYPEAADTIARWRNYSPIVKRGDRWLPEGLITYFKGLHEMLLAIGAPVPPTLPRHVTDPESLARFFGFPVTDFDWPALILHAEIAQQLRKLESMIGPELRHPPEPGPEDEWDRRSPFTVLTKAGRLTIDVTHSTATLEKETYSVSYVQAWVLAALARRKGLWICRREMRSEYRELSDEEKIDRHLSRENSFQPAQLWAGT